ncbi:MAG: hypothetical protein V2I39_04070 [Erythrobacter sp.]|jgi:hypothetical protein|nr:hypothetical protein [Erythrobacter sp.]
MSGVHSNPERPKLKGAYHPDSEGHAERSRENTVEIGGTVYVSSGDMPTLYASPEAPE